jgi:uncharacterized membrane protein YbaN (DUF454 family)
MLDYHPEASGMKRFLDDVEQALRDLRASERSNIALARSARSDGTNPVVVAHGLRRLKYLALAGGALGMTLLALVVPGVPTVPFLLAASYYLARSSPRLDEKLRRMAFLGPILGEWEQYGGLSRRSKDKLIGLTGVILLVTLVVTPLSTFAILVIVLLWCLSIYWIARLPALTREQESRLRTGGPESFGFATS